LDNNISTIIRCEEVRSHVMRDDREQLNNERATQSWDAIWSRATQLLQRALWNTYLFMYNIISALIREGYDRCEHGRWTL